MTTDKELDSKVSELESEFKAASAEARAALLEYRMAEIFDIESIDKAYKAHEKSYSKYQSSREELIKLKETKND